MSSNDQSSAVQNKTMIESIRTYVRNKPKWVEYLPLAAFAYNTTYQVSLGASPFVALRGYKERFGSNNPFWEFIDKCREYQAIPSAN